MHQNLYVPLRNFSWKSMLTSNTIPKTLWSPLWPIIYRKMIDWSGRLHSFRIKREATYLVNSLSKESNKNKINFNSIVQGGYFVFSHRGLRCAVAGRIRLESNCCGPFFPINSSSLPLSQSFFGRLSAIMGINVFLESILR